MVGAGLAPALGDRKGSPLQPDWNTYYQHLRNCSCWTTVQRFRRGLWSAASMEFSGTDYERRGKPDWWCSNPIRSPACLAPTPPGPARRRLSQAGSQASPCGSIPRLWPKSC